MRKILTQQESGRIGRYLADDLIPIKITFTPNKPSTISFKNDIQRESACIRCFDTPCILFNDNEITPDYLDGFPSDKNLNVCASNAISIDAKQGIPSINLELCLLCGVCSSRCPTGAIFLSNDGARVSDDPTDILIDSNKENEHLENSTRNFFIDIEKEGVSLVENDEIVENILNKLYLSWKLSGDRFPNFLARNLLIGAGLKASISRKGNNHMRMDILLAGNIIKGVAEVEFGQDAVLDAPRDILDAVAILISRYGLSRQDLKALIISDVLPNRRSEYWHIIQDIKNILNIKIGTVTIFTLMLLNWMRIPLDKEYIDQFYIDRETGSYKTEIIENIIGRKLKLENFLYAQIDIVK